LIGAKCGSVAAARHVVPTDIVKRSSGGELKADPEN
jgi:hypothetical protein